jgi:predicted Zn-dependent protease with MMP-like domain
MLLSDDHVLGCYFPHRGPDSIEIYMHNCIRCAARLGIDPVELIKKVCIHEMAHLSMCTGLMNVRSELYLGEKIG